MEGLPTWKGLTGPGNTWCSPSYRFGGGRQEPEIRGNSYLQVESLVSATNCWLTQRRSLSMRYPFSTRG